jgi:hypothetical protein
MHYVPLTPPPPQTTAIFRTFRKSTAPYKVHNMGLRYIKSKGTGEVRIRRFGLLEREIIGG